MTSVGVIEDSCEELVAQGVDEITARQIVQAAQRYRAATAPLGDPPELPGEDAELEDCLAFLTYEEARAPALDAYREEIAKLWERQVELAKP